MTPQDPKTLPWFKVVLFASVPLIVLVILCEIVAGLFYGLSQGVYGFPLNIILDRQEAAPRVYVTEWDPDTGKLRPGDYVTTTGIRYHVNKLGFRGPELRDPAPGRMRVMALGGSTTIGLEVSDDETYPRQLEARLRRKGLDVDVINGGFVSRALTDIKQLYFNEGLTLEPDVIVVYTNRNSALYNGAMNNNLFDLKTSQADLMTTKILGWLNRNVMSVRAFMAVVRRAKASLSNAGSSSNAVSIDVGTGILQISKKYFTEVFHAQLEDLIRHAAERGIKTVLMTQPVNLNNPEFVRRIYQTDHQKLLQAMWSEEAYQALVNGFGIEPLPTNSRYWVLSNALLNAAIRDVARRTGAYLADPVADFLAPDAGKRLFTDVIHMKAAGNRILARHLETQVACALTNMAPAACR